jgi:hypothetical protein
LEFISQEQAKSFFIERIDLQTQADNTPLSAAEHYMLHWTETENGFAINQALIDKFSEETTDQAFEKKICTLIESAYSRDIGKEPEMKETYRNAYHALRKGDHYILVMISEAIGMKLRKWRIF